jgi:hypothetical protein
MPASLKSRDVRIAPLAITEEALRLLRATRADFASLPTHAIPGRGSGFAGSRLGRYDFDQVRKQSEYLRLVSIVEAFIDACSSQQFDLRTAGRDAFLRTLADEVRETSLKGWEERKQTFRVYHGVVLGDCARWSDVDAAREARNSIAHGLGQLTLRQQNAKTRRKIETMGITFRGNELLVDDAALDRCVKSATAFIADVDRRLKLRT